MVELYICGGASFFSSTRGLSISKPHARDKPHLENISLAGSSVPKVMSAVSRPEARDGDHSLQTSSPPFYFTMHFPNTTSTMPQNKQPDSSGRIQSDALLCCTYRTCGMAELIWRLLPPNPYIAARLPGFEASALESILRSNQSCSTCSPLIGVVARII